MIVRDVEKFIRRFMDLGDDEALIVALWVVHTHVYDQFMATPYLSITSPLIECGKSRLLEVIELLCKAAWRVLNPSEAVLYRKLNQDKSTLLLDEVDTIFHAQAGDKYEHLRSLLNAGIRAGAKVPRCATPTGTRIIEYDVFCPKAITGIGTLPDSLVSRSIPIRLERRVRTPEELRFFLPEVTPEGDALLEKIEAWVESVKLNRQPDLPTVISDRQQEAVEPLLAIADATKCGDEARAALVRLFSAERADSDDSYELRLLHDIRDWFTESKAEEARTGEIVGGLLEVEESPWNDFNYGRGLSSVTLAKLLKPYGLKSIVLPRSKGGKQQKGYTRAQFEPVWVRYIAVEGVEGVEGSVGREIGGRSS